MIRTFDVRLNAAHPELPLMEATAIVGSPSTANIYNVPKQIGTWDILKVFIKVSYPNGSTVVEEAVKTAQGIWTATVPMCETSGRVKSGFTVIADGEDENGDEITGYILGVADFAVYTRGLVVRDGERVYNLRYFDIPPAVPSKGDVAPFNGIPKLYDGYNWISFADDVDLSDYYTKEETDALFNDYYTKDETDAAIDALAAYYITSNAAGANFPTRAALLSATTYYSGGVVRTPTRNDYAVVLADETHDGAEYRYIYGVAEGATEGQWEAQYPIETNDYTALSNKPKINNVELSGNKTGAAVGVVDTAGGTMTGALTVPHVDLTENVIDEPVIRTRIANGAILISWNRGTTYHKFSLPYLTANSNMITAEAVDSIFGKIAPTWDETETYAVGDVVYWFGAYYRCILGGTTGNPATDISHWTREALIESIKAAMSAYVPWEGDDIRLHFQSKIIFGRDTSGLGDTYWTWEGFRGHYLGDSTVDWIRFPAMFGPLASLYQIATEFSTSRDYAVGDICVYNRKLWRCKIAHAAGAWVGYPADFEEITIDAVIKSALRYQFKAQTVNTKQTEDNIDFEEVDVGDRTDNVIDVRITLDELRLNFPPAVSGKVRDFYLRISCYTPAPALVPVAPTGETITIESAEGTFPTIEDGSADEPSVTMLYFTETAPGIFLVKGEAITEVA